MGTSLLRIVILTLGCAVFSIASPAQAAFSFNSRSSAATVDTSDGDPPVSFSDSAFTISDKTATITGINGGSSKWHQHIELSPNLISIVGDWSGLPPPAAGTGITEGSSTASVGFSVSTITEVDIKASIGLVLAGNIPSQPNTISYLGNTYLLGGYPGPYPPFPGGVQHFTLNPGNYGISTDLHSYRHGASGFDQYYVTNYNITVSIPEPASAVGAILGGLLLLSRRVRCSR